MSKRVAAVGARPRLVANMDLAQGPGFVEAQHRYAPLIRHRKHAFRLNGDAQPLFHQAARRLHARHMEFRLDRETAGFRGLGNIRHHCR